MHSLHKAGNTIKRIVSIKFDTDFPISYENFIYSKEFLEIRKNIKENTYWIKLIGHVIENSCYDSWIPENIGQKINILLTNDIYETFDNITESLFTNFNIDNKDIPLEQWFFNELLDFSLDYTKHHITNNHFIDKIKLFSESYVNRLKFYDENYSKKKKENKKIIFTQTMIANKRLLYIIYLMFLSHKELYLLVDSFGTGFYIISEDNLHKYNKSFYFFENISASIKSLLKDKALAQLEELLQGYQNKQTTLKKSMELITKHMEKGLKYFDKIEFYIGTKNREPYFIKDIVTTSDKKKYYETEKKVKEGANIHDFKKTEDGTKKIMERKRKISEL